MPKNMFLSSNGELKRFMVKILFDLKTKFMVMIQLIAKSNNYKIYGVFRKPNFIYK